jgi:transposase-like protein
MPHLRNRFGPLLAPNENSLLKLLYAGILNASERWTHPVQNWNLTLSQLAIHFERRLDQYLEI